MKIQEFLEGLGLYGDNPVKSQEDSHYKFKMLTILQEYFPDMIPRSKIIHNSEELEEFLSKKSTREENTTLNTINEAANIVGDMYSFIDNMFPPKKQNKLPSKQACWVIKPEHGTAGNGIKFMNNAELLSKAATSELTYPFILQERIIADLFFDGNNEKDSSHFRIILSRQSDGTYEYLGGLKIGKRDSLISNISSDAGTLVTEILDKNEIPPKLLQDLSRIAAGFNINQTGFDVIKSKDGKYYVLELNDGPGVTGPLLNKQNLVEKYIGSFAGRLMQVMQKNSIDRTKTWLSYSNEVDDRLNSNVVQEVA